MNTNEQQTMLDSKVPRITGLLIIEVRDSNPNGDPDNAGFPRQRPDDRGEISPVSIKRKMRDLVEINEGESLVWSQLKERLKLGEDANNRFQILEGRGRKREEITKPGHHPRRGRSLWRWSFHCPGPDSFRDLDQQVGRPRRKGSRFCSAGAQICRARALRNAVLRQSNPGPENRLHW
jgi:hypothetical protein